jgi:long-chain acyl-CoA synthetase
MLTHRNLVSNQIQYSLANKIGPDDCYIIYMPLSHIYGMLLMGTSIHSGAKQILLERFRSRGGRALNREHRVTVLFVVPPILRLLADAPGLEPSQFSTVRFAFSAAAPLAVDVARRVEARLGLRVIQDTVLRRHHLPPIIALCIRGH